VLSIATSDGDWDNSNQNNCVYDLKPQNAMFAGQVALVKVNVVNPTNFLSKQDPNNLWRLKLSSKGYKADLPYPLDMDITNFISLGEEAELELFAGNAAVINRLTESVIQPTSFARSTTVDARIFFKTTDNGYVGQGGYVNVDAPEPYDFGESCIASDLADTYYSYIGEPPTDRLIRLKNMVNCVGKKYPLTTEKFNRATTRVLGLIAHASFYGFQVQITLPATFDPATYTTSWYIWTQDNNGYPIDGSKDTVNFNKAQVASSNFYDKSFGLYDSDVSTTQVTIGNMQPSDLAVSISNNDAEQFTTVTVFPIEFPYPIDQTSMRFSAPHGFEWRGNSAYYTGNAYGSAIDIPPYDDMQNQNQLVWNSVSFGAGTEYGFSFEIKVPNHSPVTSSNSFFLEIGFKSVAIADRFMATMIEASPVAALTNCEVNYASNLVGYQQNYIEFSINIITALSQNDGIVIKGDSKTQGFTFTCGPVLVDGSAPFPDPVNGVPGIVCDPFSPDSMPQIKLKAGNLPILPGLYTFEMQVSNPDSRILDAGTWTFGTYENVDEYPVSAQVDLQLAAPGFVVNDQIGAADLENNLNAEQFLATRDDRPGKINRLIFRFSLTEIPDAAQGELTLQGPRGFEFHENCLAPLSSQSYDLTVDKNHVFGPNTGATFPQDKAEWEVDPTACVGDGRRAKITIPQGLTRNVHYLFRITIKANPMNTPSWNKWTIDYNDESSLPFESFVIWTWTEMSMSTVSSAKSQTGLSIPKTVNPVTIVFRPYKNVPAPGGFIRIMSPDGAGYEFVATNQECQVELYETGNLGGTSLLGEDDVLCSVPNSYRLEMELTGTVGLHGSEPIGEPSKSYTLIVFVYNPPIPIAPQMWHMYTFSSTTAESSTALDESELMGFSINPVLNVFEVFNVGNQINGKTKVNDVEFRCQFPDPLINGDEVIFDGPLGFDLKGEQLANSDACNDFRYATSHNPLPGTGAPACTCTTNPINCQMRFSINEQDTDPAYTAHTDLIFKIATTNPAATPFTSDNFWHIHHMRGTVKQSSHVYPSWTVSPQLEDVSVELEPGPYAAGSTGADMTVRIRPVTGAPLATLSMDITYPTEFDFTAATVEMPIDINSASMGGNIILDRIELVPGVIKDIRINNVQLGRGGGQTTINLITFTDLSRTVKMDEKLGFTGGFRLPGKVTVHGTPELKSSYKENPAQYPVKSLFEPRVNQDARAEFRLSFSQPVMAAEKLIISCLGENPYILKDTPAFVIIGTGQVQTSVDIDANTGFLKATLKPGRPATEVALEQDTPYTVILWVKPYDGVNHWRFDTDDGGQYPTNTNDGLTPGFSPVKEMMLTVQAQRSPPMAIIDVVLNIDDGGAVVRELLIIAPPGFLFDEKAGGCGQMCIPGQALGSTGRRTATIASPTGEQLTKLTGLVVRVQTPEQTPAGSISWFVEGRGQGAGTPTGWGEDPTGFMVTQMMGTTVSYAGVANLQSTQIAFTFTLGVDAGNQISVVPPHGYLLTCSTEGALKAIHLPGSQPDCIDDPLTLQLTNTLSADEYAFAVAVDVPPETPAGNTWNLIIRDQDNNVVDAAYQIVGHGVVAIGVEEPTLAWSRADPRMPSDITVGFTVSTAITVVKSVLVTFPNSFIHDVQKPTDVQNLNKGFPVASGSDWADTSATDRIRILLDDTDDTTVINADTIPYRFTFPVLVPPTVPANNIWFLSLCTDQQCRMPSDRSVVVSFPLAGFQLYELAPEAMSVKTNYAEQARLGPMVVGLAALFAFTAFLK
jgi:hypothetical protein